MQALIEPGQARLSAPNPVILVGLGVFALFLLGADWIAGAAPFVLWAVWRYSPTYDGPPVIPLALTFQWVQVVAGLYYHIFTGRELTATQLSDYRPMVLIGLGSILALLLGFNTGASVIGRRQRSGEERSRIRLEWYELIFAYAVFIVFSGSIRTLAFQIPTLTQSLLALSFLRYGLLFLMFRRLVRPKLRLGWISVLMALELVLGCIGYFAEFREPFMILGIALLEIFDYRKFRQWLAMGSLATLIVFTGLVWTGIKNPYRADFTDPEFAASRELRLERLVSLASDWWDQSYDEHLSNVDDFVERIWPIYFPALAVSRVPAAIPHAEGEILWDAIFHILKPRILFPDKQAARSDSDVVRRYSGVWVPGAEQGTSIAFGYAAESYVDFGLPWMFVPISMYGLLMGMFYSWLLNSIHHDELAASLVTVIFWLSLYLFERSWIYMLGLAGSLIICVGGAGLLLDVFLKRREGRATQAGPVFTI